MALSSMAIRKYGLGYDVIAKLTIKASNTVYAGGALCDNGGAGTVTALANAGTDSFVGFALEGGTGGDEIEVKTQGVITLSVTGVAGVTNLGQTVYATADDTFTLSSTGGTSIGKVVQYRTGTTVDVAFQGYQMRSI